MSKIAERVAMLDRVHTDLWLWWDENKSAAKDGILPSYSGKLNLAAQAIGNLCDALQLYREYHPEAPGGVKS